MSTIKLFRSEQISDSLKEALEKLNTIQHISGQPVISYYYNNNTVNCVFAIGIKEGSGKDSYSIISTEDKIIVDKIIFGELPDITEIQKNQLILCKTSNPNKLFWVTRTETVRVVTEIVEENSIQIKETLTGKYWWVNNQELKEVSDFPTKEEFNSLLNRTAGLEQTNQGIIFPIQEKHEKDLSKLMSKSYPFQIKFPKNNDVEIFESGTMVNINLELALEYKGENITEECSSWEMKRDSVEGIIEITNPKEIVLTNCSKTETFIFKAKHPNLGEIEKTYKAIFTIKSIVGKISYPDNIKPSEFYTIGKGLPWDDDTFVISEVIDSIPEEEKKRILRIDDEEIIYSDTFNINEYPFIAIPVSHKLFSDIIDNTTGCSIINDFEIFGKGNEIELNRDYIEGVPEETRNKGMYYLYVRKHGVHSRGKIHSITFKP